MNQKHDLEKVLAEGDMLFRQQGYHNTGVEEILNKTEFPRSSFYYHFKSKEGFAVRVLEYYVDGLVALMNSKFNDPSVSSSLQRLKNYFYLIADMNVNSEFNFCCNIQRFSIEEGSAPNLLQRATAKQFQRIFRLTLKCMQAAQKEREVRSDILAEKLTRMLFDIIYGETTLSRADRLPENFRSSLETFFLLIGNDPKSA
ncbi:MAG: TetR/AcrR family transcriptional regulator [Saprospiraceae bacterium]|nr:TetR/AcrR family transcriptional regulator [Lewinella sp.]